MVLKVSNIGPEAPVKIKCPKQILTSNSLSLPTPDKSGFQFLSIN